MVIYVAYNTKLYKSTGSGWDEVRVASEWGLIANKPSTFTPTAHSHPEYLSSAGGTLSGSLSITTANFPVLDITRNTGSSGSGVYGGARLRRVTSNPQAGVGIGFYFSAPNASGAEKFAGLFGACLTNIASGAEVGQLKFTPAWHGDDPYDNTVMTLTATGVNQGRLALNGDIFVSSGAEIGGDVGVTGKIYSSPTSDSDSGNTVATKGYVDSKITSGVFPVDRIPDLDASKITSGTFATSRIPNLSTSKITSGVFSVDRIPDLDASKITSGTFATSRIPDLHTSKITTGIFDIDRIPTLPTSKIRELDLILLGKAPKTMPIYSTTSSIYTSNANYHDAIVVIDSSSTRYVYIDSDSEGTYAPPGTQITVIRKGSGNVVISASGGTYLSEGSKSYINERYQAVTLIKDSIADTWFVVGALR